MKEVSTILKEILKVLQCGVVGRRV